MFMCMHVCTCACVYFCPSMVHLCIHGYVYHEEKYAQVKYHKYSNTRSV